MVRWPSQTAGSGTRPSERSRATQRTGGVGGTPHGSAAIAHQASQMGPVVPRRLGGPSHASVSSPLGLGIPAIERKWAWPTLIVTQVSSVQSHVTPASPQMCTRWRFESGVHHHDHRASGSKVLEAIRRMDRSGSGYPCPEKIVSKTHRTSSDHRASAQTFDAAHVLHPDHQRETIGPHPDAALNATASRGAGPLAAPHDGPKAPSETTDHTGTWSPIPGRMRALVSGTRRRAGLHTPARRWRLWRPGGRPRLPGEVLLDTAGGWSRGLWSMGSRMTGEEVRRWTRIRDQLRPHPPGTASPDRKRPNTRSHPSGG